MVRIGEPNNGGYLMCENFMQTSEAIVSIGIRDIERFGCELSDKLKLPNYQYDCTALEAPRCSLTSLEVFTKACLGEASETTQNATFFSLWDILRSRNLVKRHIILKLDAKREEWTGLKYFPAEFLDYIDQIVIKVRLGFPSRE
jgi:hypothetical protein